MKVQPMWLFPVLLLLADFCQKLGIQASSTICFRGAGCHKSRSSTGAPERELVNGRLPDSLIPYHYDLELWPDLYETNPPFPVSGEVQIFFDCSQATDSVYLNVEELQLDPDSIDIGVAADSPIQPEEPDWESFETDDEQAYLKVNLVSPLVQDAKYWIRLVFNSTLREQVDSGFYWDSYEAQGETRYLAVTQFQPHYARTAFPCFDEPSFKATFDVTLVRKSHMTALSNMPVVDQEDRGDNWIADHFDTTPVMSVYLLCFAITDFVYVESQTSSGTTVRLWAREEAIYATDFALEIAGPFLEWYEEYTQMPYELPKIDHVAVPNKGGAMENWGLVIYGEPYLLWDPEWSTSSSLYVIAIIMGHEISHQWFGNIVTCAWWDDTWLNEGLASYFEYTAFEDVLGWSGSELHLVSGVQLIMRGDSLNSSSPVRQEVESPQDASSAFSGGAYYKGGAIVRMLEQILGTDTLRRGFQRYLRDNAYGAVTTDDLWQALTEQAAEDGVTEPDGSPLDIKDKLDPWVNQRGYPLLTIQRENGGQADVSQHQFLNPPDQDIVPSPWGYKWDVPLSFYTVEDPAWNTDTRIWLDRDNVSFTEDVPEFTNQWLVANTRHLDYVRVDYDPDNRAAIVEQLLMDHTVIQVENRAQIINDAFILASAGYHHEVVAMETTRYLAEDVSYITWRNADSGLEYTSLMLTRFPETFPSLQVYMRDLIDPVYEILGWQHEVTDPYETRSLRGRILWLACSYGNADCVQESRDQYAEWQEDTDTNPIHTDHRLVVYCTAIRAGGEAEWDHAHSAYLTALTSSHPHASSERNSLLVAMACSQDENTLERYYQMTFDQSEIHSQDTQTALNAIAQSDYTGRQMVWQHLQNNWRDDPVPAWASQYILLVEVVDSFATDADLQELQSFIAQYPPESPADVVAYSQAMDAVQKNNGWAAINQQELHDWLQQHTPVSRPRYETWHSIRQASHNLLRVLEEREKASLDFRNNIC